MPWKIVLDRARGGWWVVRSDTGKRAHKKPYHNREDAEKLQRALYAHTDDMDKEKGRRMR